MIIDSLNGYMLSMPGEAHLALQMHELLEFLNQKGVSTFISLTPQTLLAEGSGDVDRSYLANNVLIMRYFEAEASMRRAISDLKNRSGAHENTIVSCNLGQTVCISEALPADLFSSLSPNVQSALTAKAGEAKITRGIAHETRQACGVRSSDPQGYNKGEIRVGPDGGKLSHEE